MRAHADIDGCDDLNEKRRAAADHADDVVLDQCGVHIRCEGVDIAFEKVAEGAAADEVGMAPVAADFVGEEMEGSLVDRDDRAFGVKGDDVFGFDAGEILPRPEFDHPVAA